MNNLGTFDYIALFLVIIGAINWGFVGVGHFLDVDLDLVNLLLGEVEMARNLIYILVGLAGGQLALSWIT